MLYPIVRKEILKGIFAHRKAIFTLWIVFGAGLLIMTPKSITFPVSLGQIAGMLFLYAFFGCLCFITQRNHIAPRMPLLKQLCFEDHSMIIYDHRDKKVREIPYDQIGAIGIKELTMDWGSIYFKNHYLKEKCILMHCGKGEDLEDLKDARLDFSDNEEVYSAVKLFDCPNCVVCMYDESILKEIIERLPGRTIKWH